MTGAVHAVSEVPWIFSPSPHVHGAAAGPLQPAVLDTQLAVVNHANTPNSAYCIAAAFKQQTAIVESSEQS